MTALTDVFDPEVIGLFNSDDYYARMADLRREDPVHQYRERSWVVTRYDDVRAISRDPERFRSGAGVLTDDPMRLGHPISGSILHLDPPEHAKWRKLAARSFTPRAVSNLEPRLRAMAADVLDRLSPGDEIDLVDQATAPFPVLAIAELLGVSDGDRSDFRRWSDAVLSGYENSTREAQRTVMELLGFLGSHAAARRTHPTTDLTTQLVEAEVDGAPIPDGTLVTYLMSLLVAGNETTRHLLSGSVLALAENPNQRQLLVDDPDAIPLAVEECIRWVTPIQAFGRTTTTEVELQGKTLPADAWVVLLYPSANRDERVFGDDADRFDVTRPVPPTHVSFGFGEHLCLGAPLARLEGRIFLEEFLRRFPRYEITGPPTWVESTLVRGMHTLPVRLG